jgi:peptide deformylase
MAVRAVLRMGDPRLRTPSRPITDLNDPQLAQLVEDLRDTMVACDGAGLAAPQIGVQRRLVIFGFRQNRRYPDAPPVPETVLINPEIEPLGDLRSEGWEGCLSVPGLRGVVARHHRIRYRGWDGRGEWMEREAEGFHARVVQHECDHLDGVLFPDRLADPHRFGFTAELEAAGLIPALQG